MQTDRLFVFPCISEMEMLLFILTLQQDTSLQRTVREISSVAGAESLEVPIIRLPFSAPTVVLWLSQELWAHEASTWYSKKLEAFPAKLY